MEQMLDQYADFYLHYIGTQLYGTKRFLNESKRIGAQRTILFDILKNLHFGDKVLLAEHRKIEQIGADGIQLPEKKQLASVFSFLRVNGLSHNLPQEISEEVVKRLHVAEVLTAEPMAEDRACGSYSIIGGVAVLDDIPTICAVIKTVAAEKGLTNLKGGAKFFVRGEVVPLKTPIVLEDLKHTRGYQKVKLPAKDLVFDTTGTEQKQQVFQISNYERRMYMKKEEGEAYDKALLDEHRDVVN
jgi:hypothetical protein